MNNKLSIKNEDGSMEVVEKIVEFNLKANNKDYIVYTKNEVDSDGNLTIYVSEVLVNELGINFIKPNEETDWDLIKEGLRELAKEEESN